jgi:ammonium transporter Rh
METFRREGEKNEDGHAIGSAAALVSDVPRTFTLLFGGAQVMLIILYFCFTGYDTHTSPATAHDKASGAEEVASLYGMWQDIHVMIFVGFGFLMTFLRSYGFSSLTLNFLTAVYAIQWGILVTGFFGQAFASEWTKVPLNVGQLVEGDFAAAAALISLGACLGKSSPTQTLVMVTMELVFYAINFQIGVTKFGAADVGGTMFIHTFGAYFGLACSWVLSNGKRTKDHPNNSSKYHSDMFSMVGTIFLWVFWPSFVSVLASGNAQNRAVVHTLLSLCASCLSACVVSSALRPGHKFDMVDVQNATLAGGVTIGAVADAYLGGGGALLVGAAAGALSTVGYVHIQPMLEEKVGLYDTCGVNNLHGMPGILGGLASVVTASMAGHASLYGDNVGDVFPEVADGRSAGHQALMQLLALVVTLAIAVAGGLLTGALCKKKVFDPPKLLFNDTTHFAVPEDGPHVPDVLDISIGEIVSEPIAIASNGTALPPSYHDA